METPDNDKVEWHGDEGNRTPVRSWQRHITVSTRYRLVSRVAGWGLNGTLSAAES